MYVAITRARQRLYLSFSQTRLLHGQTRYHVRSRFLEELPEGTLKWLSPRHSPSAWHSAAPAAWATAPAPPPPAPAHPGHGFRVGQAVFHNKFGEGVIVTLEGQGDDARAQVRFGRHGSKWLALALAKLTVIA